MKRGTTRHPKVMNLAQALGIPRHHAVGILEDLWHWTAQYAPAGSLAGCSDRTVADGIGHTGDPKHLVEALISSRWLDSHPMHRLAVHDWPDHCDDSVHTALARAGKLFFDGRAPKVGRLAGEERVKAAEAIALALAKYPAEAGQASLLGDSAESPRSFRGASAEKSALPLPLPLPLPLTGQQQPPLPPAAQGSLPGLIGLTPDPSTPPAKPRAIADPTIVAALQQHVALIAELTGREWDTVCRFVTSGGPSGKKLPHTLGLARMTPEGARNSLADARKILGGLRHEFTDDQIREAEDRIRARQGLTGSGEDSPA